MTILDRAYFAQPTLHVARDLLGKLLVYETGGLQLAYYLTLAMQWQLVM